MSMELRMTTDLAAALPSEIGFNFDELKQELETRLEYYGSLVVTEDTIKESKDDRAKLNKLKTAIEDRRKAIKKEWNAPYAEFEAKVKELVALVDRPIKAIDSQLEGFEAKRREEKLSQIDAAYTSLVSDTIKGIIPLERIMDPKWLNATAPMKRVEEEIIAQAKRVNADLLALDTVPEEYAAAVKAKYIETLDIEAALEHKKALQRAAEAFREREAAQAAEAAQEPAEQPREPEIAAQPDAPAQHTAQAKLYRLRLELHLTQPQATALKQFLESNHIDYARI